MINEEVCYVISRDDTTKTRLVLVLLGANNGGLLVAGGLCHVSQCWKCYNMLFVKL